MRRVLLAIIVLGLVVVPASAGAQEPSLSVRQAGEAVVDKPVNLVAQGVTPPSDFAGFAIEVKAKAAETSPVCGQTYSTDDGAPILGFEKVPIGPFTLPFTVTPLPPPRRLLVCTWLYYIADPVLGPVATYVDVRAPRHELKIAAPRRARRGRRVTVRFTGTAEVTRQLFSRIARGSTRCGESDAANASTKRLTGVQGVPPGPIGLSARTSRLKRGTYTVCAYIQKEETDAKADKVARRVIRVR